MAAISLRITPNSNPQTNGVVSSLRKQVLFPSAFNSCFFGPTSLSFPIFSTKNPPGNRFESTRISCLNLVSSSRFNCFDIVIIGAGIIGLTIARHFLLGSDLSVAVIDAAVPCSGATGAGQGYIWRVNKDPGDDKWELILRSYRLWEMFAEGIQHQGLEPSEAIGWKKTGSLLVGKTPSESFILKRKVEQLFEAGLRAEFLSSSDLLSEEPALVLGKEGAAAFLPDDYQLDAQRTAAFIQKANRFFASEGRYTEFYHEPATGFLRSGSSGEVEAVQTSKNIIYSKKAVVIAAGCWSGSLMPYMKRDLDIELAVPVQPRKGHLLVIENFNSFRLNHGLMEVGYVDHQAAVLQSTVSDSAVVHDAKASSISMTATMDASGKNLVLGSSRQFVGFSTEIDESIINCIWKQAGEFFPTLRGLSLADLYRNREVRVGLRPYLPDGKPMIGSVPGLSNVFLATGHEGEGLLLAMGTAEMVADMVLGNPEKVDNAPFIVR